MVVKLDKSIKSMCSHHNKLIMTGEEQVGKTTILKQIKLDQYSEEYLQEGNAFDITNYNSLNIISLSLEEEWNTSKYPARFFQNKDAIIYVLNTDCLESISKAIYTIDKILQINFDARLPVLILINQQEGNEATLSPRSIKERLVFQNEERISQKKVHACCALTGEGIAEALEWLDLACNNSQYI